MEEKISKWITNIVGGSYIAAILVIALIWLVVALASGDFAILNSPTTLKLVIAGSLYLFSLYLVGTSPGKPVSRRIFSWLFSVIFHAGLLLYIGIVLEAGVLAMIFGMVETIILMLSIWGLSLCAYSVYRARI